jgi:hypothetical protein
VIGLAESWASAREGGEAGHFSTFDIAKSLLKGSPFFTSGGGTWGPLEQDGEARGTRDWSTLEKMHSKYLRSLTDGKWPASVTKSGGRGKLADMYCSKLASSLWAGVLGARGKSAHMPLDPSLTFPCQLGMLP